jgi:hypothetical protein
VQPQDAGVVEPRQRLLPLQVPGGVRNPEEQHAKTVYVRENAIVPSLDEWIGSLFAEEHLDATCEALAAVSDLDPEDDPGRELDLRRQMKDLRH